MSYVVVNICRCLNAEPPLYARFKPNVGIWILLMFFVVVFYPAGFNWLKCWSIFIYVIGSYIVLFVLSLLEHQDYSSCTEELEREVFCLLYSGRFLFVFVLFCIGHISMLCSLNVW